VVLVHAFDGKCECTAMVLHIPTSVTSLLHAGRLLLSDPCWIFGRVAVCLYLERCLWSSLFRPCHLHGGFRFQLMQPSCQRCSAALVDGLLVLAQTDSASSACILTCIVSIRRIDVCVVRVCVDLLASPYACVESETVCVTAMTVGVGGRHPMTHPALCACHTHVQGSFSLVSKFGLRGLGQQGNLLLPTLRQASPCRRAPLPTLAQP